MDQNCTNCPIMQDLHHCNSACVACQHGLPPMDTRSQLTSMPRDVEEKLLGFLNDLSGLPPLKALMLLHILGGGTLSSFGDALADAMKKAAKYGGRGVSRQLALTWFNDLEDHFGWVVALHSWRSRGVGRGCHEVTPGRFSEPKNGKPHRRRLRKHAD